MENPKLWAVEMGNKKNTGGTDKTVRPGEENGTAKIQVIPSDSRQLPGGVEGSPMNEQLADWKN